ncbi:MAG: orotidine-5'-phosphate decarboxylase [Planctomycetota bacterium]|nr:orotidine-5'-phosphate decarboxylase [Planctomycetota bacterium]
MEHFADRLVNRCRAMQAPICVGIDPVWDRLPASVRRAAVGSSGVPTSAAEAVDDIRRFVSGVLKAVVKHVPCVKFQSACFERYGWPGVRVYEETVAEAVAMGLIVVGDAKRGDIGISADHYAAGCLSDLPFAEMAGRAGPDALTINAYFGDDGVSPFRDAAQKAGKGLFALVRTSNPGGDALQSLSLADGRNVAEAMAGIVARLGEVPGCVGTSGYSLLGAVVGATKPRDAARLRELMPRQLFLVPGFGAQGGSADDVRPCFKPDGTGALITASRSVLFAYEKPKTEDWTGAIERAAVEMKAAVGRILG